MEKGFELAVFDLDGTLLDTADDLRTAVEYALGAPDGAVKRGHVFAHGLWDAETLVSGCAHEAGIALEDVHAATKRFMEKYVACFTEKTKPFDGIAELLSELSAKGIATAAFSNKADAQTKTLCRINFGESVPGVIRGAVPGVAPKPSPEGAALVMREAGVADPKKVVYIGDSAVDMRTAKNAHFYAVGVTWGFSPRQALEDAGADAIAESVSELRTIIMKEEL